MILTGGVRIKGTKKSGHNNEMVVLQDESRDRFEYEYECEIEYDFSILVCRLHIIMSHTHLIP